MPHHSISTIALPGDRNGLGTSSTRMSLLPCMRAARIVSVAILDYSANMPIGQATISDQAVKFDRANKVRFWRRSVRIYVWVEYTLDSSDESPSRNIIRHLGGVLLCHGFLGTSVASPCLVSISSVSSSGPTFIWKPRADTRTSAAFVETSYTPRTGL